VGGLAPSSFDYDSAGRLVSVINGTGTEARSTRYFYNARGDLASVVDAMGSTNQMEYDAAERLVRQTTADGRVVGFAYDGEATLRRSLRRRSATPIHIHPRQLGGRLCAARRGRDYQHRSQAIQSRPAVDPVGARDGQTVSNAYTPAACCHGFGAVGTYHYTYATNGLVTSATSPDGITVSHNYDGYLVRTSAWTGVITGAVTRSVRLRLAPELTPVGGAAR